MNIFDKARQQAELDYKKNVIDKGIEYADVARKDFICNISYYEEKASEKFFNKIKYTFIMFWKMLSDDVKSALNLTLLSLLFIIFLCLFRVSTSTPKELIHYFGKMLFEAAFLYFVIMSLIFIVSLFKKTSKQHGRTFFICWCITFLLCIPHLPRIFGYGTTQIGDFYEYPEYTENYIVTMSKQPKGTKNRKTYTLPAKISRRETHTQTITHRDSSGEIYDQDVYTLEYFIDYLYFNNGGYLYFTESAEETPLIVGKEVRVEDYNGNTYYIKLTDEKR